MTKFKKVVLAGVSTVMVVAVTISGTLAYLTSQDNDVNVMTLGNVSIEQHEYQRADGVGHKNTQANPAKEGDLVPFEQDQPLYPAVPKADGAYTAEPTDLFWWGHYTDGNGGNGLWDDAKLGNVMDKMVFVENTGNTDAYFRTVIAFECPEGMKVGDAGQGANIGLNVNAGYEETFKDDSGNGYYITIDGVRYAVRSYTYGNWNDGVLAPGETARPSLLQVVMNHEMTNEDVAKFGNNYEILVLSQAVQADGFDNASVALDTAFGELSEVNATKWFNDELPERVKVDGSNKVALLKAINEAEEGDIVVLTEDTTISGYAASEKLVIDKGITLDLNGNTITTESGWGGIDAKGGCSIMNGTINHVGNTAAIKAFQVNEIKNVTINVTQTAGKTKGGIVVQNGDSSIGSIKNVTINGATNGIECYRSTNELAIGSMKNVKINATANGIFLNGAGRIGTISNCKISGGNIGINAYLANLWHISLDIKESEISGGTGSGIDIWDEGATNTGSTVTFNYDAVSKFVGGAHNIKVTLQEEVACTINGVKQDAPCALYK